MINTRHAARGFALLIAIILTAVVLTLALALLDIAYKQLVLSSTAKASEAAFYVADSAMECALYWDQRPTGSLFAYDGYTGTDKPVCQSLQPRSLTSNISGGKRVTTFDIPCSGNQTGNQATVTVYKSADATTAIYTSGYNTCSASDTRRIERGLKVTY